MKPIPMAALVKRELITSLRNVRSFGLVALTLGFAIFITYFNLEDSVSLNEAGQTAQSIFITFTFVLLGACFLFIAPLAAVSVSTEKQEDTFTLLQLTYLSSSGIILGKALNTVGLYLLLIVASFPVIGTLFFLVGIDWLQFTVAMCLLLLTSVTVTMIGILCSTWFVNSIAAIVSTFLGMLGLLMGLPLFVIGQPNASFFSSGEDLLWVAIPTAIFEVIVSIVCFLGARQSLFFVPPPLPQEQIAPSIAKPGRLKPSRPPMPGALRLMSERYDFSRAWNPVYLKEIAASMQLRRAIFVVSIPFLAILFLAVAVTMSSQREPLLSGTRWLLVQGTFIALIVPGLVATAIAREFGMQSIDMLRMALLSARQVVLGHLGAAAAAVLPVFIAMLIGIAPIFFAALPMSGGLLAVCAAAISTVVCTALSLSIALVAAVVAKRTTTAVLAAYGLSLLAIGGLAAIVNVFFDTLLYRRIDPGTGDLIAAQFSPLLSAWLAMEHAATPVLFLRMWLPGAFFYSMISAAFILLAIRLFYRVQTRER